ncbi:hypothetical protein DPEC_G00106430 [Dallia pectoralis]|uniref:Uncharacterized protein n=1 Tax=Dallia pectoralis TaxID=75939 RepID=A0ACC2GYK6_DALPE|nr:hypothetical protein DPEC_G00106430 [Dallia pectoralis]
MASCDLPYFCPRCGDDRRFGTVPALRSHLVSQHTYETLLVLSQARARSSKPGTLVPLLNHMAARPDHPVLGTERDGLPLDCLDLACSSASAQLLRDMFISRDQGGSSSILGGATPPTGPPHTSMALALPGSLGPVCRANSLAKLDLRGLVRLGLGLDERLGLGLERWVAKMVAGVEERVGQRMGQMRAELQQQEVELWRERQEAERLGREKRELEKQASHLSLQVAVSVEMMAALRSDLEGKEEELGRRQQQVCQMERFLTATAERESEAKQRLQVFIEALLERADWAERQLQLLMSLDGHTHNGSHAHNNNGDTHNSDRHTHNNYRHTHDCNSQSHHSGTNGHAYNGSLDEIFNRSQLLGNRRSYSVSSPSTQGQPLSHHLYGTPAGRLRTLSLGGSEGWDSETAGGWATPQEAQREPPHCPGPSSPREERERRQKGYSHTPEVRGGWGQNWRRAPHSSEEEEDGDDEDTWSEDTPDPLRHANQRQEHTHGTDISIGVFSNCCPRGGRALRAETLRLRAGLFCVFPYLDMRMLLLAAEVCSDWRFVARHPAVWIRVNLENARVSVKFLVTLSQWCTQTQSLVLQNLKPEPRHWDQHKDEYNQNTRGCLEAGLEALLKSAGGSLLILHVSHCPHVLTDRSLWLASCYCRNLLQLTYRSSSDPMGHEVVWALGAGCRNIQSLQVAPLHPCQQPTRFSNRCLQTIGRCWPRLHTLSVGGAGCNIQGLAALARSCAGLQKLELERVIAIGQEEAVELCREGLQSLENLHLISTLVSPKALLHFSSACNNLRSVVVQVGISDVSDEPDSPKAKRLFDDMVNKLQALKMGPDLSEVLQIKADGYV